MSNFDTKIIISNMFLATSFLAESFIMKLGALILGALWLLFEIQQNNLEIKLRRLELENLRRVSKKKN